MTLENMPFSKALNAGLRKAMENDDRVLLMGEDIGALGGVFRVTEHLQRDFGDRRVLDTPLAESGILGTAVGILIGMNPGGAAVLGAMAGSASYIAAPAAVRIALPQASPGIYLTLALGVTFPFNLTVGIPLFLSFAEYFQKLSQ